MVPASGGGDGGGTDWMETDGGGDRIEALQAEVGRVEGLGLRIEGPGSWPPLPRNAENHRSK